MSYAEFLKLSQAEKNNYLFFHMILISVESKKSRIANYVTAATAIAIFLSYLIRG